ncbi:MAG: hypothetical protein ACFFBH_11620, partial [Promethearchaeota archaeon]
MEDFKDNEILESIVGKLNRYLNKNKTEKIKKITEELNILLEEDNSRILITYILSVLAENNFKYLTEDILKKITDFLNSPELMLNSIIILGFGMLNNSKYIERYISYFTRALSDKNPDVRDNIHYFLQEIIKNHPQILCTYKRDILKALLIEESNNNLHSLLDFINTCEEFHFNDLFWFKRILKRLSLMKIRNKEADFNNQLIELCKKLYYPSRELNDEEKDLNGICEMVDSLIILKKYNFTELNKKHKIRLKDFIEKIKNSEFSDKEIYLYVKDKELNNIYFYEFEKSKLLSFFEQNKRISSDSI